jgi:hypothetical protein
MSDIYDHDDETDDEERREQANDRQYGAALRTHKLAILAASRIAKDREALVYVDLAHTPGTVEALSPDDALHRFEPNESLEAVTRGIADAPSELIRVLVRADDWWRATAFRNGDEIDTAADQADPPPRDAELQA